MISVAALAGVGAGLVIGLSEEDPPAGVSTTLGETTSRAEEPPKPGGGGGPPKAGEETLPPPEDDPEGLAPGPSGPAPGSEDERAAAAAARAYVAAIDKRDGARVCAAFKPGALGGLELPKQRGSCARSVAASLGFARRGLPVWNHSQMTDAVSARVDGDSARVVATVFTVYADVREPTIEDDIIYLSRQGRRWLVAKPSTTMYRAIGIADIPPSVLAPPR